jgi:hypothetical protein
MDVVLNPVTSCLVVWRAAVHRLFTRLARPDGMLPERDAQTEAGRVPDSRVLAIVERKRVTEVWHIRRTGTSYKEREIASPKEVYSRMVNGRQQRCDIFQHQLARQEWGRFLVRRYRATRIRPWGPSVGLMMLMAGTIMAAGCTNRQVTNVPLGMLILAVVLITLGGTLTIASGWQILVRRSFSGKGVPLESIGISSHALGFLEPVTASEVLPEGYRPGRFKGRVEIEAPVGEWEIVEEYSTDAGWYRVA